MVRASSRALRTGRMASVVAAALLLTQAAAQYCCCGFAGVGCTTQLDIVKLPTLSGTLVVDSTGRTFDGFGNPTTDLIYGQIDVPAGATSLRISTCMPDTQVDTVSAAGAFGERLRQLALRRVLYTVRR